MRILHVIPWMAARYGGPPAVVLQGAAALQRRGHEVEIITTAVDGPGTLPVPLGVPVVDRGVPIYYYGLVRPRWYLTSPAMCLALRSRVATFDVVHVNAFYRWPTEVACLASRRRRVPYVLQPHGVLDPWHTRQRRIGKRIYHWLIEDAQIAHAAAVQCTSRMELEAVEAWGVKTPSYVVPSGLDIGIFVEPVDPALLFSRFPVLRGRVLVTFLGRLAEEKGLEFLPDAFAAAATGRPDAHLVVAGPDDEGRADGVRFRMAELGLSEQLTIMGTVTGEVKVALLQASRVFVLPSRGESFGLSVAEAMAAGVPVVISPNVAIADIVEEADAGLIVPRDARSIGDAIAVFLGDSGRAAAVGKRGQRMARMRFSWDRVAEIQEAVYEQILQARPSDNGR
jgi:glycosyltransferase involved in cell wall biosynthesis